MEEKNIIFNGSNCQSQLGHLTETLTAKFFDYQETAKKMTFQKQLSSITIQKQQVLQLFKNS